MNLVDIVLGLGLLWSTLRGWRIGLVRSVIGLLGLFLAYGLALVYGRDAAAWLVGGSPDGHTAAALLGFLSVFLLVLAACAIGGRIVRGVLHLSPLGLVDAAVGAAAGLGQGVLVLGLLTILLRAHPLHSRLPESIDNSTLGPPVQHAALVLMDAVKTIVPRAADLYNQWVPERPEGTRPAIVDEVSGKADAAKAKLDSLIKDTRERLESD